MTWTRFDTVMAALCAVPAAALLVIAVLVMREQAQRRECLALGYPNAVVHHHLWRTPLFAMTTYCLTHDRAVPLQDARTR